MLEWIERLIWKLEGKNDYEVIVKSYDYSNSPFAKGIASLQLVVKGDPIEKYPLILTEDKVNDYNTAITDICNKNSDVCSSPPLIHAPAEYIQTNNRYPSYSPDVMAQNGKHDDAIAMAYLYSVWKNNPNMTFGDPHVVYLIFGRMYKTDGTFVQDKMLITFLSTRGAPDASCMKHLNGPFYGEPIAFDNSMSWEDRGRYGSINIPSGYFVAADIVVRVDPDGTVSGWKKGEIESTVC